MVGQEVASSTELRDAVLRTLAYSDVFDYPLTAAEVHWALPLPATLAETEAALRSLHELVGNEPPYFYLAGREGIVAIRERRQASSARLRRRARPWNRVIAALPFVFSVIVTGSLAVDNAEMGEDVDYLIVSKPGRVWTARAFTVAVVRLARLAGVELCPNYVVAADALKMDKSAYVARELAQMQPVSGIAVARRLLDENPWWRSYLPNATPATLRSTSGPSSRLLQRLPETLLGGRLGEALERAILQWKAAQLRRDAGSNAEAVFDERMAKGHVEAHRSRIEAALAERFVRLGLQP
ncbi:MAG: hypothetical protein AB7T32_16895 [Dehalococcoidia bacterium]